MRFRTRLLPLALLALLPAGCTSVQLGGTITAERESLPSPASEEAGQRARFVAGMLPLVSEENERLAEQRRLVLQLQSKQAKGVRLSKNERTRLAVIAERYRLAGAEHPAPQFWSELLARVDEVPVELALAQAANESNWGRSRFAREGNNYFGQWCFEPGCGLVPLRRNKGARHEVTRFDSAAASISSYMQQLNSLPAYAPLRANRAAARAENRPLDAAELADGLHRYSERGAAYVRDIRSMIGLCRQYMEQNNSLARR